MENNFKIEEMKQQWTTLQTALNNQKEVNIKLILRDARKRVSWNKGYLRVLFFLILFFVLPVFIYQLHREGIPQSLFITIILLTIIVALVALYMSFIIKSPNNGKIDIIKYSKSLVKFKKVYIYSTIFLWLVFAVIIIWVITSMQIDITSHRSIIVISAGAIGAIFGISLDLKMLGNIKELQNDIDLIEGMK